MTKNVLMFYFTALLGNLYVVVDQIFSAQLRLEYLSLISVLGHLPLLFAVFGIMGGHTLLILIGKESTHQKKSLIAGAIFQWVAVLSLIALIFLAFGYRYILGISDANELDGATMSYFFQLLAAGLTSINFVLKFTCLANGNVLIVILSDVVGNVFNALGNTISLTFLTSMGGQFIGISLTTLLLQIFIFLFLMANQKCPLRFSSRSFFLLGNKNKMLLFGELILTTLAIGRPFVWSLMISGLQASTESLAAYNVSFRIKQLLFMPVVALITFGVAHYSQQSEEERRSKLISHNTFFVVVFLATFTPLLISIIFAPEILNTFFELHTTLSRQLFYCILLTAIPLSLVVESYIVIKAHEKHLVIAFSELFFIYFMGIGFFLLLRGKVTSLLLLSLSFVIPSLFQSLLLYLYHIRLEKKESYNSHLNQSVSRSLN